MQVATGGWQLAGGRLQASGFGRIMLCDK